MKHSVIPHSAYFLVTTVWILSLGSCTSVIDPEYDATSDLLTLEINLGDGQFFTVKLSDMIIPDTRIFDDIDDLYQFMDSIDASGQVLLNTDLFHRLKHALYPYEIAALDLDGTAIVGDLKYLITNEKIQSINITEINPSPQLETYYGLSGDEYLVEFAKLASNLNNINEVSSLELKDPEILSLYKDLTNHSLEKIETIDQEFLGPYGGTFSFTPIDPQTGAINPFNPLVHERGYNIWNQSIGRFIRRSIAYTGVVYRPLNTERWYGYNHINYTSVLSRYNSTSFVKTSVKGGKERKYCTGIYECTARAPRKKKTGTTSQHSAGFRVEFPPPPPDRLEIPTYFSYESYHIEDKDLE
ncbi:MAG: hypothetical protein OXF84_12500 [Bacteroidetes bacterium]|nr:hypothetical protein [Bacteroidota bacterium]